MEGALAVVSYPKFSPLDQSWIESFRKANDFYYKMISAHLTIVFPVFNWLKEEFIDEIRKQVFHCQAYRITIRCAIRNNDLTSDFWHVLLVPDAGFSETVKLHDKLYSGKLAPEERLDLDFVPHIGIANSKDPSSCRKMVHEVNSQQILIQGVVEKLDIIEIRDGRAQTLEILELA